MTSDGDPRITAEASVREVIARFPSTGAVFLQHGPLAEAPQGSLYLAYPDWTVAEFAERRGVSLPALLGQLEAEAAAAVRPPAGDAGDGIGTGRPRRGFAQVTIGYTGSYRERDDVEIEERSVVATQSAAARGPD